MSRMLMRGCCRRAQLDGSSAAHAGEAGCRAGGKLEGLRGILKRSARRPGAGRVYLVLAVGMLTATPALADSTPPPAASPALARLQGQFLLAGRVTVAKHIAGERVGQNVLRTWTFISTCPTGQCATLLLLRPRAGGQDTLALQRKAPGYYTGAGSFYAPLQCDGQIWPRGEVVPFTVTVQVTAAVLSAGGVVATRVNAGYTNRSRTNRTPCVAVPGHDAGSYRGHLVPPTSPTGGTGTGP